MTDREIDAVIAVELGLSFYDIDDPMSCHWSTNDADAVELLAEMTRRKWRWQMDTQTMSGMIRCTVQSGPYEMVVVEPTFAAAISKAFMAACESQEKGKVK